LFNNLFANNVSSSSPSYENLGGAIKVSDVATQIINSTISANIGAGGGGGVYIHNSPLTIKNSILWDNIPNQILVGSGTVEAEYSNIMGGWAGIGNIDQNPEFYDPITGDYSLGALSPCRDSGTPDTTGLSLPLFDLAGNLRIGNARVDMGAYEYYDRFHLMLKVFLEGPFNGNTMDTILLQNDFIPANQPYITAPWNYTGIETVIAPPDSVVDWALVELRHSAPMIPLLRFAGFLKYDGTIVNLLGQPFSFQSNIPDIYAVIYHRNHLGILSANPLTKTTEAYTYDFTTSAAQAYNNGQKEVGSGVWGMVAGDANASGVIDISDIISVWNIQTGKAGYLPADINLNGQVDNRDKNDLWLINTGTQTQVPDN
jgi:hypothetical protein